MKIRLDALNLDNEESLGEDEMVKIQSEMVKSPSRKGRRSRAMVEKRAPVSRIPNMSSKDSVKHVLKLITEKPMTSRDIEMTLAMPWVSSLRTALLRQVILRRQFTPCLVSIPDMNCTHQMVALFGLPHRIQM